MSRRGRGKLRTELKAAARSTTDECIMIVGKVRPKYRWPDTGRQMAASRAVWIMANGDPGSTKIHVRHTCHNGDGGCVNIRHLRLGTPADNVNDTVRAGRHSGRGERNRSAKLTEDQVREIRRQHAAGTTFDDLAMSYGVVRETIWKVSTGRGWRHVA